MKKKEKMRKVSKWWWVWDFEKEEQWLNDMALQGWKLEKVRFTVYYFIQCEPGEYIIRLEMHSIDDAYCDFMRETGAEYIGRMAQWIYFCKPASMGDFDIFSDIDSKIDHLKLISGMLMAVGIINIILGTVNTFSRLHLGVINLLCGCLLMYALGRIHGKIEQLKKERMLHE